MPRSEHNERPCSRCRELVIDVRDKLSGATFPVDAEFTAHQGYVLEPPTDGRRNPWAHRAEVYIPHHFSCRGPEEEEEEELDIDGSGEKAFMAGEEGGEE